MLYFSIKVIISAVLIVLIAEVAKKSAMIGAVLASVPLISVLAMVWLYMDSKDVMAVSRLSIDVFWLVIPSLLLFISLPLFLQQKINFYFALFFSLIIMVGGYFIMILILKKLGLK